MLRRLVKYVAVLGFVVALGALLAPPSEAAVFQTTQVAGFDFGSATTGSILTGTACCGTIDFFNDIQTNLGGKVQYQTIAWGCPGDGTGGSTSLDGCTGGALGSPTSAPNVNTVTADDPLLETVHSALSINTFAPFIEDNGVWHNITQLLHFNRVIDADSRTLGTVAITGQISLDPDPGDEFPNTNTITIGFLETLNIAPCGETENPLGSTCDDVFSVLTLSGLDAIPFDFEGQQFVMEFRLQPPCSNVVGSVPGTGPGGGTIQIFQCNGDLFGINFDTLQVYASEDQDSSIFVQARILAVAVPNPATAVLFGLGLLGIGAMRPIRRKFARR